nr:protein FAM219B isoform X6 [Anas platyrhynchos]
MRNHPAPEPLRPGTFERGARRPPGACQRGAGPAPVRRRSQWEAAGAGPRGHGDGRRRRARGCGPGGGGAGPGATPRREQAAERSGQRRGGEEGALPALPGPPRPPQAPPPRSRGGYVALSQVAEDGRLSPSSGSDGELESRGSSGYSSAEVNQELSRQLLRDGYHLDEVPDDEDLDLIPPKPAAAPCPWCFGDSLCCVLQ